MRIYYDWEFVEDGRTIAPISLGMKADDGTELYRIVDNDVTIGRAFADPWLRQHVIPHLPVEQLSDIWAWKPKHPDMRNVRPLVKIAHDVKHFVTSKPDPELWADYGAYDHVCLAQLFGRMIHLPKGFPMYTNDLQQEILRLGLSDPYVMQQEMAIRGLSPQDPATVHSSIGDARYEKQLGDFLLEFEQGEPVGT